MKYKYPILLTALAMLCCAAQAQEYQFAHSIGGRGIDDTKKVLATKEGTYIVVMEISDTIDVDPGPMVLISPSPNYHRERNSILIYKCTAEGRQLWVLRIGGKYSNYVGDAVLDKDDNIIVSGQLYTDTGLLWFNTTTDLDPGPDSFMIHSGPFMAKYNTDGGFVWAKGDDVYGAMFRGLTTDTANNIYTTGSFDYRVDFDLGPDSTIIYPATGYNYPDAFLAKYDSMGNFIWVHTIGTAYSESANAIHCAGNKIYVAGNFTRNCDFDFAAPIVHPNFYPPSPAQTISLLAAYTTDADFLWLREIPDIHEILTDDAGNVIVQGYFQGALYLGTPGNTMNFNSALGATQNNGARYPSHDVCVAKFDTAGNLIWAKQYGGEGEDVYGTLCLSNDQIYFTCSFYGPIIYSEYPVLPDTSLYHIPINLSNTLFRLDSAGNTEWMNTFNVGRFLTSAPTTNGLVLGGDYGGTIQLTGMYNTFNFTSVHSGYSAYTPDALVIKFVDFYNDSVSNNLTENIAYKSHFFYEGQSVTAIKDEQMFSFKCFPNPANDLIFVQAEKPCSIKIIDLMGRAVSNSFEVLPSQTQSISLQGLSGGVYLMVFYSADNVYRISRFTKL